MKAPAVVDTRREVLTPDGVPLAFQVAPVGDRMAAFVIDFGITLGAVLVTVLCMGVFAGFELGGWAAAFAIVASFLIWNFYFVWFEVRWQGATPGKRFLRTRVIDARGGMLSGEAVFARNLTRNIELHLPLTVLLAPDNIVPELSGAATLGCGLWLFTFALLPLFNRDRRRVGDLIGGTLVVKNPRSVLLADVSHEAQRRSGEGPELRFSDEQLGLYGVYELQVLEDVLRRKPIDERAARVVCEKVQRKIGWEGEAVEAKAFLRAFYAAQRAHLEQKMLFGERRERKRKGRRKG